MKENQEEKIVENNIVVEEKKGDNTLAVSILVAAVLISGSILYMATRGGAKVEKLGTGGGSGNAGAAAGAKEHLTIKERDVILGDPDAPVTLIEYGDYQCPFCGRFFSQTEPLIKENYVKTGKVKMIYRDMAFLGPESVEAAEAAECAKDQGKFWAFHDALFVAEEADGREHNGNLNRELFLKIAGEIKMDANAFTACYDGNKYAAVVNQATADARGAGVNATPTSFVNGELISGAVPYAQFQAAIDRALGAN